MPPWREHKPETEDSDEENNDEKPSPFNIFDVDESLTNAEEPREQKQKQEQHQEQEKKKKKKREKSRPHPARYDPCRVPEQSRPSTPGLPPPYHEPTRPQSSHLPRSALRNPNAPRAVSNKGRRVHFAEFEEDNNENVPPPRPKAPKHIDLKKLTTRGCDVADRPQSIVSRHRSGRPETAELLDFRSSSNSQTVGAIRTQIQHHTSFYSNQELTLSYDAWLLLSETPPRIGRALESKSKERPQPVSTPRHLKISKGVVRFRPPSVRINTPYTRQPQSESHLPRAKHRPLAPVELPNVEKVPSVKSAPSLRKRTELPEQRMIAQLSGMAITGDGDVPQTRSASQDKVKVRPPSRNRSRAPLAEPLVRHDLSQNLPPPQVEAHHSTLDEGPSTNNMNSSAHNPNRSIVTRPSVTIQPPVAIQPLVITQSPAAIQPPVTIKPTTATLSHVDIQPPATTRSLIVIQPPTTTQAPVRRPVLGPQLRTLSQWSSHSFILTPQPISSAASIRNAWRHRVLRHTSRATHNPLYRTSHPLLHSRHSRAGSRRMRSTVSFSAIALRAPDRRPARRPRMRSILFHFASRLARREAIRLSKLPTMRNRVRGWWLRGQSLIIASEVFCGKRALDGGGISLDNATRQQLERRSSLTSDVQMGLPLTAQLQIVAEAAPMEEVEEMTPLPSLESKPADWQLASHSTAWEDDVLMEAPDASSIQSYPTLPVSQPFPEAPMAAIARQLPEEPMEVTTAQELSEVPANAASSATSNESPSVQPTAQDAPTAVAAAALPETTGSSSSEIKQTAEVPDAKPAVTAHGSELPIATHTTTRDKVVRRMMDNKPDSWSVNVYEWGVYLDYVDELGKRHVVDIVDDGDDDDDEEDSDDADGEYVEEDDEDKYIQYAEEGDMDGEYVDRGSVDGEPIGEGGDLNGDGEPKNDVRSKGKQTAKDSQDIGENKEPPSAPIAPQLECVEYVDDNGFNIREQFDGNAYVRHNLDNGQVECSIVHELPSSDTYVENTVEDRKAAESVSADTFQSIPSPDEEEESEPKSDSLDDLRRACKRAERTYQDAFVMRAPRDILEELEVKMMQRAKDLSEKEHNSNDRRSQELHKMMDDNGVGPSWVATGTPPISQSREPTESTMPPSRPVEKNIAGEGPPEDLPSKGKNFDKPKAQEDDTSKDVAPTNASDSVGIPKPPVPAANVSQFTSPNAGITGAKPVASTAPPSLSMRKGATATTAPPSALPAKPAAAAVQPSNEQPRRLDPNTPTPRPTSPSLPTRGAQPATPDVDNGPGESISSAKSLFRDGTWRYSPGICEAGEIRLLGPDRGPAPSLERIAYLGPVPTAERISTSSGPEPSHPDSSSSSDSSSSDSDSDDYSPIEESSSSPSLSSVEISSEVDSQYDTESSESSRDPSEEAVNHQGLSTIVGIGGAFLIHAVWRMLWK